MDPWEKYSSEEMLQAVEAAGMGPLVAGLAGGLDHILAEGGAGLSLGQRQLVCLARALLRHSRLLVLDEATAAMDAATDNVIQETIRREFDDCTVITIAHRLNTVIEADQLVVMDKGRVMEKGRPRDLLREENSTFYSMATAAGIV